MPTTDEIPLFPLSTVLVPGGFLPLRIFEPRYLDMVRECAREDAGFGVCLVLAHGHGDSVGQHARTGTAARIRDFHTLEDGLLGISAEGGDRFRVRSTRCRDNGLLVGRVDWLEEPPAGELPEDYAVLSAVVARFMEQLGPNYPDYEPPLLQDPSWVGYRLTELLPFGNEEKQRLLEVNDPLERLQLLLEAIPRFQGDPRGE